MRIKTIIEEDFGSYKKTSMLIGTVFCDGKCWREQNLSPDTCQNEKIMSQKTYDIEDKLIIEKYLNNPITHAIVFGGLEPVLQSEEIIRFIKLLREDYNCEDDVVIYTGYDLEEVTNFVTKLRNFSNIIVKFGRYIPNQKSHIDSVLGVSLASGNQYAIEIG